MANTDNLLELVRASLEKAGRGDLAAAKNGAAAFAKLDAALCAGALLPEDWEGDDDDAPADEGEGDDGDGEEGDDADDGDDDAAEEMRRVLGQP